MFGSLFENKNKISCSLSECVPRTFQKYLCAFFVSSRHLSYYPKQGFAVTDVLAVSLCFALEVVVRSQPPLNVEFASTIGGEGQLSLW